ncbi:unnamed protein product [Rangifer tarandus platyrhynchus]|uniref:Uncharacterized protein n=2 Tax=Rangifer tarandus platyrhynchus TaxID=3082113 RepID=A0AC59YBE8_RANTA|nr:unnamed protein product [Rangifer tarandus platyrhynchus]
MLPCPFQISVTSHPLKSGLVSTSFQGDHSEPQLGRGISFLESVISKQAGPPCEATQTPQPPRFAQLPWKGASGTALPIEGMSFNSPAFQFHNFLYPDFFGPCSLDKQDDSNLCKTF